MEPLESHIADWRAFLAKSPAVIEEDVDELETHLREQVKDLANAGLSEDEAFLIAVRRMGSIDELSHEFAREHSGRLWKQLVLSGHDGRPSDRSSGVVLAFASGCAVAVLIALLVAGYPNGGPTWLFRNASLLVLPFLAGWLAHRRQVPTRTSLVVAGVFAVSAVLINVYPWQSGGSTEILAASHLVVVSWFVVAFPYMGGDLRSHERRMGFVRFTGEWAIYYTLIALGGGVLMGLTAAILEPVGVDTERIIAWVLPTGAAGAVIVAAWLVESKQQVVENMAPVLTMIFTPLFAVMLTVAAVTYAASGVGGAFDRELLGVFDLLMVVVLGLVLYSMSARDPSTPPAWMDRIQLIAVAAALVLDVMVLASMVARIGDLGFTPNRTVALGLNIVLLVNLAVTARLSIRFATGRGTFHEIEHWQTAYLPVFGAWAVVVVVIVPLLFGFA